MSEEHDAHEGNDSLNRREKFHERKRAFRAESKATKFVRRNSSARDTQNPYREPQQRKSFTQIIKSDLFALGGAGVLVFAVCLYLVFFTNQYVLSDVQVNDTKYVPKDAVTEATKQQLQRKTLWLIPADRYFTVRPRAIQKAVTEALGSPYAVEGITIQRDYPRTLRVQVSERIPGLVWITKDAAGKETFYTVDHKGYVTEEFHSADQVRKDIPRLHDKNRQSLGLGWNVVSQQYVQAVITLSQALQTASIPVDTFELPALVCKEQEYVAEQIFASEIAQSESDEMKDRKREIQEQFKKGQLSIDESLDALEKLKQEEFEAATKSSNVNINGGKVEWATVNKEVACDFVTVASDVTAHTTQEWGGVSIKFDTLRSIDEQVQQLQTAIHASAIPADHNTMQYIDVRIPDRIYYK